MTDGDLLEATRRLTGVDRLRLALTIGVIATHAVITYAGKGSWFYPILVGVAPALRNAALPTGLKLAVLLPSGVLTGFAAAALLRRIPGLRPVLR